MSKEGDIFKKELVRVGSRLVREILILLGKIETDDRNIITTKINLELALRSEIIIRQKILELGYEKSYLDFKFDVLSLLKGLRQENIKAGLSDELAADAVLQLQGLEKSTLERDVRFLPDNVSREISQIIYDGVLGTLSVDDLLERIENKLQLRFDQAVTLSEQYVSAARNTITIGQAEGAGIKYYLYAGVDDSLTRPFCEKMINKIWTLKELDALGDDPSRGKQPLPVSVHLGGFNCRHFLEPLDDNVVDKMIKSGEAKRGKI